MDFEHDFLQDRASELRAQATPGAGLRPLSCHDVMSVHDT